MTYRYKVWPRNPPNWEHYLCRRAGLQFKARWGMWIWDRTDSRSKEPLDHYYVSSRPTIGVVRHISDSAWQELIG